MLVMIRGLKKTTKLEVVFSRKRGSYNVYDFHSDSLIFVGAVLKQVIFSEDNA